MSPALLRFTCLPLAAATLTLAGCVVAPLDEPYYPAYDRGTVHSTVIYTAPPAPLVEYRGWPPAPGHVWLDGYWNWGGASYLWMPGRWVEPRPSQVWVPRVWQRDGERWRPQGGHWEPRREERRPPPPPVWQRRESQPQQPFQPRPPEPSRRLESRPEPQPESHHHPFRDGGPPPALSRPALPQPPGPGTAQQLAPEPRKAENFHLRPREPRTLSPAVSQEPHPRPTEANPQRRGLDDGGRRGRKWPEDGEPRDRHPNIP